MNKKQIKRVYNAVVILLLLAAVVYSVSRFVHWGRVEWTDDAQVCRHITPINSRVQGYIKEIRFEDNQFVHRGDTLVVIDDSEFRLHLSQAEAAVDASEAGSAAISAGMQTTTGNVSAQAAGAEVASAGIEAAQAAVSQAQVGMENARKDYERFAALLEKGAVTQQQYDHTKAQYDAARSAYDNALAQQEAARARLSQAHAATKAVASVRNEQAQRLQQNAAGTEAARSQKALARLNLSYTVIVATADGVMDRKQIHEGQLIQPGQLVARIIDDAQVWVTANFRERQMRHIQVGNRAEFRADAVPDVVYRGDVESIAGATGGATSANPVDNATGNFVKVEQRVPVRIRLSADNRREDVQRLLAGLNVECEVKY
ncbi:MAG: HlyD family secretion protein [Prevotella sp.]|nr:HlyD family secretion protein [Prevotella sp.]